MKVTGVTNCFFFFKKKLDLRPLLQNEMHARHCKFDQESMAGEHIGFEGEPIKIILLRWPSNQTAL